MPELAELLTWRGPNPTTARFLMVFMDQNNKCNLRCLMCGFSDARVAALPRYDLPRALYDRIAAELFPHANFVCLSLMTEPFMTRDFPDRLMAVREAGVPYSEIITNGTLLTAESARKVIEAGITRVTFSIDGGTKEVFESIRIGASFERVLANFELLRGGPRLRVNHVLSDLNVDRFDDFLDLMERLRPHEVAVRTISRMSNAVLQESRDAAFWSKVQANRAKLEAFCARTGIADSGYLRDRHTLIDLGIVCPKPWDTLAIHPNGDVYPCMAWSRPPVGNIARDSFDAIWNGDALDALRREFTEKEAGVDCLNCTIRRGADDLDDDFFFRKLAK
jgi:radical SAM protein with 4Fe4S-binding SPASM domain